MKRKEREEAPEGALLGEAKRMKTKVRSGKTPQTLNNDGPPRASLLGLPAEIRNEIYRLSVVEFYPIPLILDERSTDEYTKEPGLSRCCRQIREESLEIFSEENTFDLEILHLKREPHKEHWIWRKTKYGDSLEVNYRFIGRMSWSNFKTWLKDHHAGNVDGFLPVRNHESGMPHDACAHLFEITEKLGDLPWERVERVLETCRLSIDSAREGSRAFFDL